MSTQRPPPIRPQGGLTPWGAAGGLDLGPRSRVDQTAGGAFLSSAPSAAAGIGVGADASPTFSLQEYALLNGTQIFTIGTTSEKIIPAPSNWRNLLILRNSSASATAVIFVNFGADATTESIVRLAQNEVYQWDSKIPQDEIYAICSEAAGRLSVAFSLISTTSE